MSKKKILASIASAEKAKDWPSYRDGVMELAHLLPGRYASMLARERLLPAHVSEEVAAAFLAGASDGVAASAAELFQSLAVIDARVRAILERTNRLQAWQVPFVAILQFGAMIESQARQLDRIGRKAMGNASFPQGLLGDDVAVSGGGSASVSAIHEVAAESFEVVLRHVLREHRVRFEEMPNRVVPLEERSFRELAVLAQLWRGFEDMRRQVVFLGWRARPGSDGSWTFEPPDRAEHRRMEIGMRRRLEQFSFGAAVTLRSFGSSAEHAAATADAVRSLHMPAVLETWGGEVDRDALRRMMESDAMGAANDANIEAFFYEPLAKDLEVGSSNLPWRILNRVSHGLTALAEAFEAKLQAAPPLARVVLLDPTHLSALLGDICGITPARAADAIAALTFDASLREVEIWDTPLIPAPRGRLLLVPQLVKNAMSLRRLENFATEHDPKLLGSRGAALENFVAELFERQQIEVQAPVRFGSTKTECDVVVWWDGWLILLEAKCTKSIFSPYDVHRGRETVEEAAKQLEIRRDAILANWSAFRAACRDLSLPEIAVSRDRIALIAITNVPHFTPAALGDVLVTDDWCLQRFFSDPSVTIEGGTDPMGILAYVRPPGAPFTPASLFEYLRSPGQVQFAEAGLEEELRYLPSVDEQPPVVVARLTYSPPLVDLARRRMGQVE